ncbi:hypothetical protein DFH06DRAFT_1343387 [Mycena polygramma]|nr:hypothetical protein DFH06DRAFT_1343387 [Mycena polygramma]
MAPGSSKRGRGGTRGGRGSGRGGAAAGTKRPAAAADDSDYSGAPSVKKPRTSIAAAAPPAAPLVPTKRSSRSNAGKNMAELVEFVKPRPKRTHDEVLEAEALKAAAADKYERQRAEYTAYIAALDAAHTKAQAEEDDNIIYSIDDLPADAGSDDESGQARDDAGAVDEDVPMLEFTEEQFERIEDDEAYLSVSEYEKPTAKPRVKSKAKAASGVAKPRPKKAPKGSTRQEIEKAAQQLEAEDVATTAVKKKGVQKSNAASASAKAGLSAAWKKKAAVDTTPPSPKLGGFTDEDAAATRPDFGLPQAPRVNQLEVKLEVPKIAALSVPGTLAKKKKVKTEASSGPFTPASSADANGLPAFIHRTWSTLFLPKLYLSLYLSHIPMVFGSIGTDPANPGRQTVAMLQELVKELYPHISYVVEWTGPVCEKAISRVHERCSLVGKGGKVFAVNLFDKGLKYHADFLSEDPPPGTRLTQVIADDVKYFIHRYGPAFYKIPTPETLCKLGPDHPSFEKPVGYLESAAVIHVIAPYIAAYDWSIIPETDEEGKLVVDWSVLPVGLLAMGAASVERGFKMHASGVCVTKPPDFSVGNYSSAVAGYVKSIKGFKPSRWQSIITACGARYSEVVAARSVQPDASLDGIREHMYIPSSP